MRKPLIVAAVIAAALFTVGYVIGQIHGITPSSAASNAPNRQSSGATWRWESRGNAGPHAAGQVTAINGNTITIKPLAKDTDDQSAVTTIVVTGTTKYSAPATTATPSKASIKVGSYIAATGTLSSDGKTLTASQVVVLPNGASGAIHKQGRGAAGQVTAISGNNVTIKPLSTRAGATGTVTTIVLTGSTQYFAAGKTSTTKSALKVGSYVVAEGTVSTDGKTLTASRVEVLPSAPTAPPAGGLRHFGPGAAGQVTAINGNTFTIKPLVNRAGAAGTVTSVVVTGTTKYTTKPDTSATKAAVKVGSYIIARGALSSDGKTLTATQVDVLPSAPTFGPFHGFGRFGDGGAWQGPFGGFDRRGPDNTFINGADSSANV